MPDRNTAPMQELEGKRNNTLHQAQNWLRAFYGTVVASVGTLLVKDWRESSGEWKKFFSLKNPLRVFKTPKSAAVAATLITAEAVTAGVSLAKASKAAAYNDAILSMQNAPPSDTAPSDSTNKSWVSAEVEKTKDNTQQLK